VLPRTLGDAAPELVHLQDVDVPARPVWLVFARQFRHDPRIRAVVDALVDL
jgi:DNA-binding transcriptional LysR family regulator